MFHLKIKRNTYAIVCRICVYLLSIKDFRYEYILYDVNHLANLKININKQQ